jgi:hypothetical protein
MSRAASTALPLDRTKHIYPKLTRRRPRSCGRHKIAALAESGLDWHKTISFQDYRPSAGQLGHVAIRIGLRDYGDTLLQSITYFPISDCSSGITDFRQPGNDDAAEADVK